MSWTPRRTRAGCSLVLLMVLVLLACLLAVPWMYPVGGVPVACFGGGPVKIWKYVKQQVEVKLDSLCRQVNPFGQQSGPEILKATPTCNVCDQPITDDFLVLGLAKDEPPMIFHEACLGILGWVPYCPMNGRTDESQPHD